MGSRSIGEKALSKLAHHAYKWIRRDAVSGLPILQRNDLVHLGSVYGGWVIPASLFSAKSVCYCVGCGEDITFDLALIERFGCQVYGFDPTPRAIQHVNKVAGKNPLYRFSDIGLWDRADTLKFFVPSNPQHVSHSLVNLQGTSDYLEVRVDRLATVMKGLRHERIDLLKLDIEGAEYKVLGAMLEDKLDVGVLCIEFDEYSSPLDRGYKGRIRDIMLNIANAGYDLVCVQGGGNYTFVRRD